MKTSRRHRVVLVTVPNRKVAKAIAHAVLKARAAACASVLPGVESHYWWQGRIEVGKELLLLIKTSERHLKELERLVHENHPYDTPEFVVLNIGAGSARYLDWIDASTEAVLPAGKLARAG